MLTIVHHQSTAGVLTEIGCQPHRGHKTLILSRKETKAVTLTFIRQCGERRVPQCDVEGEVKFASSQPMRNPVRGDRTFGYPVNTSSRTESVRVSTLEPTCNESILPTNMKKL